MGHFLCPVLLPEGQNLIELISVKITSTPKKLFQQDRKKDIDRLMSH